MTARSPTEAAARPAAPARPPATLRSTVVPVVVAALCGSLLGACAHAPPSSEAAWLDGAPSAQRVGRRAAEPRVCRTTKPTGSHVEQQVCLSPEDDRLQRDAARRILQAASSAPWRGR